MRGYILILTSGILFFIIAVVTILHLMSAKSLNQQYRLNQSYQDVLNRLSIKSFISYLVDINSSTFQLPNELSTQYTLTNQQKSDGSFDFFIKHSETERTSTFNILNVDTQSSISSFDQTGVAISGGSLTGLQINATSQTDLVALRTVWYPFNSQDVLINYSFVNSNGTEFTVTPNATSGEEFQLASAISSTSRTINLNFSALPDSGVISIYFRYSDGSIQNAHVEY